MTRAISFGFAYFLIKVFAQLPFSFLNAIGYGIFLILDNVLLYRKEIIIKNLRNSFPEKSEHEIKKIKRNFYRYFTRLLVENIKMFRLPLKKLEKYVVLKNPELLRGYYENQRDVAVMAAHYGNWEYLLGLKNFIPHHPIAIFKSLNNKYFDTFFTKHRSQYGAEIVPMREIPRILLKYNQERRNTLSVFISDQSPVWEEIQYWTTFLGQDTPVYLGAEKLARKMKMAVVYFRVRVEEKNSYVVEAIPITDDASLEKEYYITEKYFSLLEEDIRLAPEYWLWSHRRWKLREKREKEEMQGKYRFEGKFRKK